jgi:hypothetical protein
MTMVFGLAPFGDPGDTDEGRMDPPSLGGGGGSGLCMDERGRGLCAEDETIVLGAGERVADIGMLFDGWSVRPYSELTLPPVARTRVPLGSLPLYR